MNSACIDYVGSISNTGYGLRQFAGKLRLAHRVAYCVANNIDITKMLPSQVVLHGCDNRACVNPEHLRIGTQSDNCRDRSIRAPRGEKRKLTADEVLVIKSLDPIKGRSSMAKQLGITYNVDESTIRKIWYGKYWGYI